MFSSDEIEGKILRLQAERKEKQREEEETSKQTDSAYKLSCAIKAGDVALVSELLHQGVKTDVIYTDSVLTIRDDHNNKAYLSIPYYRAEMLDAIKRDKVDVLRVLLNTAKKLMMCYELYFQEGDTDSLRGQFPVSNSAYKLWLTLWKTQRFYADDIYKGEEISLLLTAVQKKSLGCVKLLINEFQADPSTIYTDQQGVKKPIIMAAIEKNLPEMVVFLLEKQANLTAHEEGTHGLGLTPLLLAAKLNQLPIVAVLMVAGADCSARDNNGQSAFELATDPDVKNLLSKDNVYEQKLLACRYTGGIPKYLRCEMTGELLEYPITYNGITFNLKTLIEDNEGKIELFSDPQGNVISKEQLYRIVMTPKTRLIADLLDEFIQETGLAANNVKSVAHMGLYKKMT